MGSILGGQKTPAPQPLFPGAQNQFLYGTGGATTGPPLTGPTGLAIPGGPGGGTNFGNLYNAISSYYGGAAPTGGLLGPGGAGATGMNTLQNIASGVNFLPVYNAIAAAQQQQTNIGTSNILESFGAQGLRYSSGAGSAVGQFLNQQNLNLAQILSQGEFQAVGYEEQAAGTLESQLAQAAMAFYQPGYTPSNVPSFASGIAQMIAAYELSPYVL